MIKNILYLSLISLLIIALESCKKDEDSLPNCYNESACQDASKANRKVLIIGIDGFRADCMQDTISPFLFTLSQSSNTYFTNQNQVEYYTSSGPNWTSLLTGLHSDKHLVIDNFFSLYSEIESPHFFNYVELANSSLRTASISHWLPINGVLAMHYADVSPIAIYTDLDVFDQAQAILNGTDSVKADVLFLHFDDLDHFGHAFGYSNTIPEYVNAVSTMDGYAQGLLTTIEAKRNAGEDWMVFIVSDHGGEGTEHSNGAGNPNIDQTIFYANHPTIAFKSNYVSSQVDLVPTVLAFLGITSATFDNKKDGISLIE